MTCPPPHELAALCQDDLPPERATEVLRHAAECPACTETLRELSDPGSLAQLFEGRHAPVPAPAPVAPAPVRVAPSAPAPRPPAAASLFGRWGTVLCVAVAGALGLAVAFGTKVRQQSAALRDADAAHTAQAEQADQAARRAAAELKLANARHTFDHAVALLDDGDPGGDDAAAKAAAAAREVADDPAADDALKAAAAAVADEATAVQKAWPPVPQPHPTYHPRLAVRTRDGKRLLTVAADPRVVVWDGANGAPLAACVPTEPVGRFEALAVSTNGRYVAAGGADGRVWVWEVPAGGVARPAENPIAVGGGQPVWVVWFAPPEAVTDPPPLFAAGPEGAPRRVRYVPRLRDRPEAGPPPPDLDREAGPGPVVGPVRRGRPVAAAGADPSGRFAFTADADGTVRYWDVATRRPLGPAYRDPGPPPR